MISNKYNAKRTKVSDKTFASRREAEVYQQLLNKEQAHEIADLECQPAFPLIIDGHKVTPRPYRADFRYFDMTDQKVHVLDVKGVDTREGKLRRHLAEILHRIHIEVVK